MPWTFENGIPIYRQLTRRIMVLIASGSYKPGDKLPSVRDLAIEAGVNPNTMQRAYSELEQLGVIYTERTSGRYVTDDLKKLTALRIDLSTEEISRLYSELEKLGLSDDEIRKAVIDYKRN